MSSYRTKKNTLKSAPENDPENLIDKVIDEILGELAGRNGEKRWNQIKKKLDIAKGLFLKGSKQLFASAISAWLKAMENSIEPEHIFLLGWYAGEIWAEWTQELEASIHGREHRLGKKMGLSEVEEKYRNVYAKLQEEKAKAKGEQRTLKELLLEEFEDVLSVKGGDFNKEYSKLRAKYYRQALTIAREKEIRAPEKVTIENYLGFRLRHHTPSYRPEEDMMLIGTEKTGIARTEMEYFRNEQYNQRKSNEGFIQHLQQKKNEGKRSK